MLAMANLDSKLVDVVGDRTSNVLAIGLGFSTVVGLLRHYPRRYVLRGELTARSEIKVDDI